ncbi:hypothetical protein FSU_0726 [Fibrobacter succinogenes subsp. succinogenes S85]|uniref:Uncharacterized protein n=1 Tax=Fibrobacter succinogenes (strain ATCC 19169 / S85) TaxID=59374 RepID=D9S7W5_FIBSS|nr:hypothetical protein FSU_0726 [Fibrobacter succinogenes subsp. succinogenes S85]
MSKLAYPTFATQQPAERRALCIYAIMIFSQLFVAFVAASCRVWGGRSQ